MFDLAVIGGGPAGISCANEAKRLGLDVVLVEKSNLGGSVRYARKIENFPPFLYVSGKELCMKLQRFVKISKVEIIFDEVLEISYNDCKFNLQMRNFKFVKSKSVFIATGQKDYIPKEYLSFSRFIAKSEDVLNKDFENKEIVVYGGGDVAFDTALSLSDKKAKVKIICRSEIKAKTILQKEADSKKIEIEKNCSLKDIKEEGKKIILIRKGFDEKEISCDVVVFATGKKPNLPRINFPFEVKEFNKDELKKLSELGFFFGGDVIRGKNRNVAVALGDGITGAFNAYGFLKGGNNVEF